MLVIVTPDIGSLAARIMGGRWWHYRVAHINFFNRRSLAWLLASTASRSCCASGSPGIFPPITC